MRPDRSDMRFPQYLVTMEYENSKGNSDVTSSHFMYRTIPEDMHGTPMREARDMWRTQHPDLDEGKLRINVLFEGWESWCLGWFNHWTFDFGQTDAEVLASFDEFVSRHERWQEWPIEHRPAGWRCLMGAEDRWRWVSNEQGDPPPCRCEHCQKQGVIRINH